MEPDIILRFSRRKKHHATHLQVKQHFKHIAGATDPNIPKFKIVVVGPKHSGKSSLCQTFLYQHFDPVVRYETFATRRLKSEATVSELNVFDTAGHEKYSEDIANAYYRDASAVLICFSLIDRNTFLQALDLFVKDCLKYEHLLQNTVFYLIGNKYDLENERQVRKCEIEWASTVLKMKYFELAATNVRTVTTAFRKIAEDLQQLHRESAECLKITVLNDVNSWQLFGTLFLFPGRPLKGCYAEEEEAARAYDAKAIELNVSAANDDNAPPIFQSQDGKLELVFIAENELIQVLGQNVSVDTWNGSFIAPVLVINRGDNFTLTLVNHMNKTNNIHFHGMEISPEHASDDIVDVNEPYHNDVISFMVPLDHPAGLFWYHSHAYPVSEEQVMQGMRGAILIQGLLDPLEFQNGLPNENFVLLYDVQLDGSGIIPGTSNNTVDGGADTNRLVNGLLNPNFTISPNEMQLLHIANIAADLYYNLTLDGLTFHVIAQDGRLKDQVIDTEALFMPPGSRYQVLVVGPAESCYILRTENITTGPAGDIFPLTDLATFCSQQDPANNVLPQPSMPTNFPKIRDLRQATITNSRTLIFSESEDGNTFFINGKYGELKGVDVTVHQGDIEEWTIFNNASEWHVFHIHQLGFQVTEINGQPVDLHGHIETMNLDYFNDTTGQPGSIKVIIPFDGSRIVGTFVYHCHILNHEDRGMIGVIKVVPSSNTTPDSTTPSTNNPSTTINTAPSSVNNVNQPSTAVAEKHIFAGLTMTALFALFL